MQSPAASRKRSARGAEPMVQQPTALASTYQYQQLPESTDFTTWDFPYPTTSDQTFSDPTITAGSDFAQVLNASQSQPYGGNVAPAQSTDLVRRARNQQLAPHKGQQQEQWTGGFGNMNGQADEENEQDLDVKVRLAKQDAQGKRKQIPPFVQKLSSFLDSSHTDLIRWSDDGRSFIVLDEDEFARTLIPELFKHNNYASFVRQLNMYGFHKTVNITDGSLRQSEKARKGVKPPSMYSHPYFRKNRPDLLWLIQKPSGKSTAKRKRDGTLKDDFGSDDERQFSPVPDGRPHELAAPGHSHDLTTLPRNELTAVRQELRKLQSQQALISQMISRLKDQNDEFYRQAASFQALHDRHENSINAILTFLRTFYNRSLESGQGAQTLLNMFSIPQSQQHGSVVEEFHDGALEDKQQIQRYVRKPPLLLPGPETPGQLNLQPGGAVTQPSSARPSASPPGDSSKRGSTSSAVPDSATIHSRSTVSPAAKNEASTPNLLNQVPDSDKMMNLIQNINATNAGTPTAAAPALDLHSALHDFQHANGNVPLTPQQRDDMLAIFSGQGGGDSNGNNAVISPQPPAMDMRYLEKQQQQLEALSRLQKEQDAKVQELNRRLQPLSPTGTIPGLADTGEIDDMFNITGGPGDFDPNAFINFDDLSWQDQNAGDGDSTLSFDFGNAGADTDDIDWDFGANDAGAADMFQTDEQASSGLAPQQMHDVGGAGRVESVSSEATSPATTVRGGEDEPGTPRKRTRRW